MSIKKVPHADGSYHYALDYYDQAGTRHYETARDEAGRYLNQKEAKELEAKRRLEIGNHTYIPPEHKRMTFSELADRWLAGREGKVRPVTLEGYRIHIETHLKPHFGPYQIGEIGVGLIDAYCKKKAESIITGGDIIEKYKKPLSTQTLNKTLTTLSSVLKWAVRLNLLEANPVLKAERPKTEAKEQTTEEEAKKRVHALNGEQIRVLLDNADPGLYRTLILTALMTGARQGELIGLKWGDINWQGQTIHVQRGVSKGRFYAPKNASSRRKIEVSEELLHELKVWRMQVPASDLDDLVFPGQDGRPLERTKLNKQGFMPAVRRAGIGRVRFHDLRHTYASLLLAARCSIVYVSKQMGHRDSGTTLKIYAHLIEEKDGKAARLLAETVMKKAEGE